MTRAILLTALGPLALAMIVGMTVGALHAPTWLALSILVAWSVDASRQTMAALAMAAGDHE